MESTEHDVYFDWEFQPEYLPEYQPEYLADITDEDMKDSSKRLLKFRILEFDEDVPSTWRWATVYDVEDSRSSAERTIRDHIGEDDAARQGDHQNYFLVDGEVALQSNSKDFFAILHSRISVSSEWKLIVPLESIRKLLERTLYRNHGFSKTDVDALVDAPGSMLLKEMTRLKLTLKSQKFLVAYFLAYKSSDKAEVILQNMNPIVINTKEAITLTLNVILPSPSISGCSKEQLFINAIDALNLLKTRYKPEISKVYYNEVSSYAFDTKELTRKNIDAFNLDIDCIIVDVIDNENTPANRLLLFENFLPYLVTHDKLKVMDVLHRFFESDAQLGEYLKQKFNALSTKSWGNVEKIVQLLDLYFQVCFIGREEFTQAHDEMIKILIRIKKCNAQDIRQFIARTNIPSIHKPRLLDKITALLPSSFLGGGTGGWNLMSIIALFFIALDIGSDFQLTAEYYEWEENMLEHGIGREAKNVDSCESVSCRVEHLDKKVAFAYSLTILLLMEFFQILYLYKGHSGNIVRTLDRFFLGKHSVSKGSIFRLIRRVLFELMCGVFLPFAIGIYEFILNVQAVQLSNDHAKRRELDINTTTRCDSCKELRSGEPCVICGYGCTFTEIDGYSDEIKVRQDKASKWNGNVKLLMTTVEDTYMPILQFYFVLPLVMKHMHSGEELYLSILSGNRLFIFSLYSIISSILNMASMRSTIFFTRDSKEGLGIAARVLFYISVILTIIGRILTIEIFALICLPSRFAPLWLALICLAHCLVVLLIKSFSTYLKMNNRAKVRTGIVRAILLSSFSCVFTYSKEVTMKKMTPRDYKYSFVDRTCFTLLLFAEQLAMTVAINEYNTYGDINTVLILQILWAILALGFLIEWVFLVFINPWAPLRYLYEFKKMILSSVIVMIILICIISFLYYFKQARIPVIAILIVWLPFLILIKFRARMTEKDFNETTIRGTATHARSTKNTSHVGNTNNTSHVQGGMSTSTSRHRNTYTKTPSFTDQELLLATDATSEKSDGNYRMTETV